jgi:hypothetical protein
VNEVSHKYCFAQSEIRNIMPQMTFDRNEASKLLALCHRRCCICHRFCGVKMELHHVQHQADGGSDDIDNAIPLCFECHAEVNHYNDRHPRGRKFTNEELLSHKHQWLKICSDHPEALISAPRDIDVGPLEGMVLELGHNNSIIKDITDGSPWQDKIGCVLLDSEYKRAVAQGSLLLLSEELKRIINRAYASVGRINTFVNMYANTNPEGNAFAEATNRLLEAYRKSGDSISNALSDLKIFLLQDEEVKVDV